MRGSICVVIAIGACGFSPSIVPIDSPPLHVDVMPDMSPMAQWSKDAASGRGVPRDSNEWTAVLTAASLPAVPPTHVWLMQETSGNLADSIGTAALTPINGPGWGATVPGWDRKAVDTTPTAANHGFYSNATGNMDGRSYLFLAYVALVSAPASEASLIGLGQNGDHRFVGMTSFPHFAADGVGIVSAAGAVPAGSQVHPLLMEIDQLHATYTVYTDVEKVTGQWKSSSGQGALVIIGNAASSAASADYLYAALWDGPAAGLSDSNVKAMLEKLGWTVSGY